MRLGILLLAVAVTTYDVIDGHPTWTGVSNEERPSSGARMKKCTACQKTRPPTLQYNLQGGGNGSMNSTQQDFFSSMLRNMRARDHLCTSEHPCSASVGKNHPTIEKKQEQSKFIEDYINKPIMTLNVHNADQSILGEKPNFPSLEKQDCGILKCLSLYQALQRLQRNSSKGFPKSSMAGSMLEDKRIQSIDDITKQMKMCCKRPKPAIKERIRKLIDHRIRPKNGSVAIPEIVKNDGLNLSSSYEDPIYNNGKQIVQEIHIPTPKSIDAIQSETKDKINVITSTPPIIPSTPATITVLSENLLESTKTTPTWDINDTGVKADNELHRAISSTDESYLQSTINVNNDYQTTQADFTVMNDSHIPDPVTQVSSSTIDESYLTPTTDKNNDYQTTQADFTVMNDSHIPDPVTQVSSSTIDESYLVPTTDKNNDYQTTQADFTVMNDSHIPDPVTQVASSTINESYLLPTTDGNNDYQTTQADFTDMNVSLKLDPVTQGPSSTTEESYLHNTTDENKYILTILRKSQPINVTSGRLLEVLPGRILFLYKNQTVPILMVRTENGTTIAIDGDYLCNTVVDDPRYDTKFSKLCFSI